MTTEQVLRHTNDMEKLRASTSDLFLPSKHSCIDTQEKVKEEDRFQSHRTCIHGASVVAAAAEAEKAYKDNITSKGSSKYFTWPKYSAECLPSLADGTIKRILQDSSTPFPINEECTSLTIPPSGRHIIAGFTDGTVRLFDTTGRLWSGGRRRDDDDDSDSVSSSTSSPEQKNENQHDKKKKRGELVDDSLFACDSSTDSKVAKVCDPLDEGKRRHKMNIVQLKKSKQNQIVLSKTHQTFGAVACQIYARGVITSLLMDVASSEDGLFAFGGVLRGSTELVAVDLSGIETFHDDFEAQKKAIDSNYVFNDLLDLIQVYRYSDAKLKGFGSCTRLKNGRRKLEYRLFTGKGIKNMHIWAFVPPHDDLKEPIWQCLYDTATNGNTINYLHFRYDSNGLLQGITKSDDQRLRVWDLSFEQHKGKRKDKYRPCVIKQLALQSMATSTVRPKRPPCVDVACTENALGVFGSYVFSSGKAMYNQISVTCLDVDDVSCSYNHTELALPFSENPESADCDLKKGSRNGRQQRGDLKSVASISGLRMDGRHVVLEMSDRTLMHYSQNDRQESSVQIISGNANPTSVVDDSSSIAGGKTLCVSRIGCEGYAILVSAQFDPIQGRGYIRLRELTDGFRNVMNSNHIDTVDFWGFHGSSYIHTNPEIKIVDELKNLQVSAETPKPKFRKSVDQKKNKKLIESKKGQLFVTPETKAAVSRQKLRQSKSSDSTKISPVTNDGIEITSERDQAIEKGLILPTINTSQMKLHKTVNLISDSPDKHQSLVVAEKQKRKATESNSSIASFFQRSKVKKVMEMSSSGIKDPSSSPIISISTSDIVIGKVAPTSLIHDRIGEKSTEILTSYEFSTKYADTVPKEQNELQVTSAVEMFYSAYRNKRYCISMDSDSTFMLNGVDTNIDLLSKTQEIARNKLSRKHYSEHERFLKSFLSCSHHMAECANRNDSKGWLEEFVHEREQLLRDLLERQAIEAETLASLQSHENRGSPVPKVLVSFPFPEIFSNNE